MTSSKETIQVITSVERKRKWALSEKHSIVQETYLPGMNVSLVARKYGINPSQVFVWRRLMEEGALEGIRSEEGVVAKGKIKELEQRIKELERILGKKTLENEVLKEAVKISREKKLISQQPLSGLENFQ